MQFVDHGKRLLWVILLVAVLVSFAGYQGLEFYRSMKRQRALNLVAEGRELVTQENLEEAATKMQLAFGLAPNEPEVLRFAAKLSSQTFSPHALDTWRMLLDKPDATLRDHLDYCQQLLRVKEMDRLNKHLLFLAQEHMEHEEVLELSYHVLMETRRPAEALQVARHRTQLFPENDRALLHYGDLLLKQPNIQDRNRGVTMLWTVAIHPGPEQNDALLALANHDELSQNQLRLLQTAFEQAESDDIRLRLAALDLRQRLEPNFTLDQAVQTIREWHPEEMSASDLAIVCDWLLRRNHAETVLEWVHEERARNDFNLLQRHLMALMLLNRWQETSRLLADNTFPMHPVFQEVSRAIVAHQEKHEEGVIGYLNAAILAAHDDPDLTLFVANYAEGLNKPLVAVQALQRLMVDPVRAPRIATRIFQLLAPLKESMPMMRVVDQATKFASEDPKLLNEQAWWHLIVEGHQDKFLRQAQSLHESDPKDPYYAATLALAQLLGTQLEAAFTTLDPWSDQLETAPARLRLVYTACLGANGQGVAARSLASSLADLTLKDREQALIQPWL